MANCPNLDGLVFLSLRRATNFDRDAGDHLMNSPFLKRLRAIHCPEADLSVREHLSKRFRFGWQEY
jgi:hypothetical protein